MLTMIWIRNGHIKRNSDMVICCNLAIASNISQRANPLPRKKPCSKNDCVGVTPSTGIENFLIAMMKRSVSSMVAISSMAHRVACKFCGS